MNMCQDNATFILQMHTHTESFVLKYSFASFILVCLNNVIDVKLLLCPGILRSCIFALARMVKQESLKVFRDTRMILQKWIFKSVSPL